MLDQKQDPDTDPEPNWNVGYGSGYPTEKQDPDPNKSFRIHNTDCTDKITNLPTLICIVADPGCLSRIPDPDFYPTRILDLGSRIQKQQQKRGVKKIWCHTF